MEEMRELPEQEKPHDILAAEEFSIGTRDDKYPRDPMGIDQAHDVLAAEEHPMPERDDRFPRDPTGIPGPHDVLAAEEFAMPAGPDKRADGGRAARGVARALLLGAVLVLLLRRRRS